MARCYMRFSSFLFVVFLSTSSFLLSSASAAVPEQQQQNSTTTHEPFSAATARAAPTRGPTVLCSHESSRNVIRRCMTWIVTVGPDVDPTRECCDAVRKARLMPCLCTYITRDMEDLVSVNKLIRVFDSCGKRVRPGIQCASYTVPRE